MSTSEFKKSGCKEKDLEESSFPVIMSFQDFLSPGTGAVALTATAPGAFPMMMRTAAAGGDDDSFPTRTSSSGMEGEYGLGDEDDNILVTDTRCRCTKRGFVVGEIFMGDAEVQSSAAGE